MDTQRKSYLLDDLKHRINETSLNLIDAEKFGQFYRVDILSARLERLYKLAEKNGVSI